MTRKALLALLILIGGISQAADKPNILFIAVDDLNDWIGPLKGHPQVKTPHMDRLAARGTTFLNAHCQSPLCNSSRTSLMTGLRPTTTGVYALQPWFRTVKRFNEHVTLPQHLAKHGYRTYSGGKVYHGHYGCRKSDREFDVIGVPGNLGPYPPKKLVNTPHPHRQVDWGFWEHKDEDKGDHLAAGWAEQVLDNMPRDKPFFLALGFSLPHVPCYATQKWFDLYPEETTRLAPIKKHDRSDTPRASWYTHWKLPEPRLKFMEEENEILNFTRSYLACISFVDHQLGRVLAALKRNGLQDNTVVVLWSDHGYHLGEKEITGKNTLWDRSTRVPLIFAGPGVDADARCDQPAELLDLYPTLLELCAVPANESVEGLSLLPQLKNANTHRARPAITSHGPGNHGIRTREWRYIRYADGSEELYNMKKDPNEWDNLASDPAYAAKKTELAQWLPKNSAAPAPGSKTRLIERKPNGDFYWELEKIEPTDAIPEI